MLIWRRLRYAAYHMLHNSYIEKKKRFKRSHLLRSLLITHLDLITPTGVYLKWSDTRFQCGVCGVVCCVKTIQLKLRMCDKCTSSPEGVKQPNESVMI